MSDMANSDFGKEVGLIHKVIVTGRKAGAGRKFWTTLADDAGLFRKFVEFLNSEKGPVGETYNLLVDWSLTVGHMIRQGSYGRVVNTTFPPHYPMIDDRQDMINTDIHLIHFGREMSTLGVVAELEKRKLRPAELPELLTLGACHLDLQREFPIAGLGSIWRIPKSQGINTEEEFVACLAMDGNIRVLSGHNIDDTWHKDFRFAAVPK